MTSSFESALSHRVTFKFPTWDGKRILSTFYPFAQLEFLEGRFVTDDLDSFAIGANIWRFQPRLEVDNGGRRRVSEESCARATFWSSQSETGDIRLLWRTPLIWGAAKEKRICHRREPHTRFQLPSNVKSSGFNGIVTLPMAAAAKEEAFPFAR